MGDAPTIRPLAPADLETVLRVHVESILAFGSSAYDRREVAAWAAKPEGTRPYERALEDAHTYFVVAERNGDVAGFGGVDVDSGEIVALYVDPDHARSGVGSALLSHLETYALDRGYTELSLWSSLNAVDFYERVGYEPLEETVHETTDGVELNCLEMRKRIG